MSSKKGAYQVPTTPYRDDPDYAETASMASAVLLDDVDMLPDEELPAYEDNPSASLAIALPRDPRTELARNPIASFPPSLPFSSHNLDKSEHYTNFPNYSTEADALCKMIQEQASYPPNYYVQISGSHQETQRHNNKTEKKTITDFFFFVKLSDLLYPVNRQPGFVAEDMEFLPDNVRGYRGTRLPSLQPTIDDVEGNGELMSWCENFVTDKSKVKSFTLRREIRNHDTKKLEQLLRSAISETGYRGHTYIKFPSNYTSVTVYSPGLINTWRVTTWIRWFFYLTLLVIFAYPFLFFTTSRYDVVKSVWYYADKLEDDGTRNPTVMSEVDWFYRWKGAVKRAAVERTTHKNGECLDEQYRLATLAMDQRGAEAARNPANIPSTGNSFADGALNLLGQGLRVASDFNNARGWGGDC